LCLWDNIIPVEMTPYRRNLILNEDVHNDERTAAWERGENKLK